MTAKFNYPLFPVNELNVLSHYPSLVALVSLSALYQRETITETLKAYTRFKCLLILCIKAIFLYISIFQQRLKNELKKGGQKYTSWRSVKALRGLETLRQWSQLLTILKWWLRFVYVFNVSISVSWEVPHPYSCCIFQPGQQRSFKQRYVYCFIHLFPWQVCRRATSLNQTKRVPTHLANFHIATFQCYQNLQ